MFLSHTWVSAENGRPLLLLLLCLALHHPSPPSSLPRGDWQRLRLVVTRQQHQQSKVLLRVCRRALTCQTAAAISSGLPVSGLDVRFNQPLRPAASPSSPLCRPPRTHFNSYISWMPVVWLLLTSRCVYCAAVAAAASSLFVLVQEEPIR